MEELQGEDRQRGCQHPRLLKASCTDLIPVRLLRKQASVPAGKAPRPPVGYLHSPLLTLPLRKTFPRTY